MHKQKDDRLRDFLQEYLSDYEHPVKNDGWFLLEKKIPQKKTIVHNSFWIVATSVAAGLLLVLGVLFFFQKSTGNQSEPLAAMEKDDFRSIVSENNMKENYPVSEIIADKPFTLSKTKKKESPENILEPQIFTVPDTVAYETTAENASSETGQNNIPKTNVSSQFSEIEDIFKAQPELSFHSYKKNFQLSVAGKNSFAGNNSLNINEIQGNVFFRSYSNSNNIGLNIANQRPSRDELTRIDYKLPINLSLLVRKNLSPDWGVETGVSYTYLASEETWHSTEYNMIATNAVALHYLGIPVKVSYTLLWYKQWNVYLAGGGMIEKCMAGEMQTTENTTGFRMKSPLSVPEWQLSWMGNIGIGYRIYTPVSVFLEPGFNYFPNDGSKVMTIRKDRPFTFNLQAGLRFDLN